MFFKCFAHRNTQLEVLNSNNMELVIITNSGESLTKN